jgi:hypothetical protein
MRRLVAGTQRAAGMQRLVAVQGTTARGAVAADHRQLTERRYPMRITTLAGIALFAVGACAKGDGTADSTSIAASDDPAVKAANVANAIAANQAGADSILTANGYTRESFDKQLLDIAADSAMSARYAAAKK